MKAALRPSSRGAAPKHEIVALSFERAGERAGHGEAEISARRSQDIAILAKGEERLDPMIAVRLPPPHMQREVQLGIGDFVHF